MKIIKKTILSIAVMAMVSVTFYIPKKDIQSFLVITHKTLMAFLRNTD